MLAAHGLTLDPETSEIRELAPYVGAFSARTAQIRRNVDRYEAAWRAEHPGEEPGPAAAGGVGPAGVGAGPTRQGRPERRRASSWTAGTASCAISATATRPNPWRWRGRGRVGSTAMPRPTWSSRSSGRRGRRGTRADIRGKTEVLLAQTGLLADPAARIELAEDITARATDRCVTLLTRPDVPEHVRSLTSPHVLEVEADLITRLARRADQPARRARIGGRGLVRIDPTQAAVVGALAGDGPLVVVEGAAGAGKTTALRSIQQLLSRQGHRLLVVTPTLKAAEVAAAETGAEGHSAAWLIHQHGWRWDDDGHWTRQPDASPDCGGSAPGR